MAIQRRWGSGEFGGVQFGADIERVMIALLSPGDFDDAFAIRADQETGGVHFGPGGARAFGASVAGVAAAAKNGVGDLGIRGFGTGTGVEVAQRRGDRQSS